MVKRLLVTGGAGFIAHHIVEYFLKNTDWEIITLDRLDLSGNLNRLQDVISKNPEHKHRVKFVFHDLKAEISKLTQNFIGDVNYILHLAAGSHVDRSIEYPMEFVLDNVVGTTNVLEFARKHKSLERMIYFSTDEIFGVAPPGVNYKERDRYNSTNPYSASKAAGEELCVAYENTYNLPVFITHCHDEETLCWTETGFKSIDELKLGELVWVLKENKTLALEPILEIVDSPYQGDMYNFVGKNYDYCVTPNHRMLNRKRNENTFSIRTAEELYNCSDRFYLPVTGEWNDVDCDNTIDISKYLINSSNFHYNSNKLTNYIYPIDKFMKFIGWYVSEGYLRDNGNEILIAQKATEHLDEIKDLIGMFGFSVGTQINKNGTTVFSIHSKELHTFLKTYFGGSSYNKRLPEWIKAYSKEFLKCLFDSAILGDGTRHKTYLRYYSVSEKLCDDIAELAIKLGYSAKVSSRLTFNPRGTKSNISYYTSISVIDNKGTLETNNKSVISHYDGRIWCVRTNSGNFFTKRNGKIACSGNTMNVIGERQHPEKFVPLCIRRIRNGETIEIHSNKECTEAGSRFYIHAVDVADAMLFLLNLNNPEIYKPDFGGAKCPKFNVVGKEEIDNLSLAKTIAKFVGKELKYKMVDFHTSRPGHDLRYSLSGDYMRSLGWEPKVDLEQRINEIVDWSLANPEWIEV